MNIYLSGSMEYAHDGGVGWRSEITPKLESLGYKVLDPAVDNESKLCGITVEEFNNLKLVDLDEYKEIVRKGIITTDIIDVAASNIVLVYYDKNGFKSGGTISECMVAYILGIPLVMVSDADVGDMSGWVLSEVSRHFKTFDVALEFLADKRLVNDLIVRCTVAAALDPVVPALYKRMSDFMEIREAIYPIAKLEE